MKTLTLEISESLEDNLSTYAKNRGVSKAAVVREVLTRMFKPEPDAGTQSALSLVEDLVGLVDGPEDLSCNPEHLESFGR